MLDKQDATAHGTLQYIMTIRTINQRLSSVLVLSEYMNQSLSLSSRSRRLSEVLNPNYEDLSQGWGTASPYPPLKLKPRGHLPEGPEYMNTAQSLFPPAATGCLENPDYQAHLPAQAPASTLSGADVFLPAAENLEYLGVGPLLYSPGR